MSTNSVLKIQQAEEKGLLVPHSGDTIYEGTVGSTGEQHLK